MSEEQIALKLQQFDDFFSIKHNFNINVQPLTNDGEASYDDFVNNMPTPFKLASNIDSLDQAALAPLGAISGVAGQLVKYLNHQAQKIDLLVNYVLSEQDDEQYRYKGITFGGGGIEFIHNSAFNIKDIIEVKIFLAHENCAIYCHAEVIYVEAFNHDNGDQQFIHKVIFHHIREDDRERLVRSSLHLQSKQLQQLAKERNREVNK